VFSNVTPPYTVDWYNNGVLTATTTVPIWTHIISSGTSDSIVAIIFTSKYRLRLPAEAELKQIIENDRQKSEPGLPFAL
jgi:hypothetical protein